MYKDQGGECIELQGIKCYLPPVPSKHEIQGSHLPKKEQRWYRTELPTFKARDIKIFSGDEYQGDEDLDWDRCRREEIIGQSGHDPWDIDKAGNPKKVEGAEWSLDYVCPQLNAFRTQELTRIFKTGHWFMNNGKPTYLTGPAYFYFNWWKIDTGFPEFRQYLLEIFYLIEIARKAPYIIGVIIASMRGVGKTYVALCILYILSIMKKQAFSGMQSKTDKDAANMFKKMLMCIGNLPEFLIPTNTHGSNFNDLNELHFVASRRKHPNLKYDKKLRGKALNTSIDYRNANDGAYDGETTAVLLEDEIGKIAKKIGSVKERFSVARFCVQRGSEKRGILFGFTTVGNMERGGGEEFKQLYYDSKPTTVNEVGWTKSGCICYFIPDIQATIFDIYGQPIIEPPKDKETIEYIRTHPKYGESFVKGARYYHDIQAQQYKNAGQENDYISYKQKNPRTEEEAFMFEGKKCIFNAEILQQRQIILTTPGSSFIRRGDIVLVDKVTAKFVDNATNGKWAISYFPDASGVWKPNNVKLDFQGLPVPLNDHLGSAGADPISAKKLIENPDRASDSAVVIRSKYNFNIPDEFCEVPIALYLGRSPNPHDTFNDAIAGAIFFGLPILIENNKEAMIDHFYREGMENFVMKRPQTAFEKMKHENDLTPGVYSGTGHIDQYTTLAKTDIQVNGHKWKHIDLVQDALRFDPSKTTQFDAFVAYGNAVVAAQKPVIEKPKPVELSSIIPRF